MVEDDEPTEHASLAHILKVMELMGWEEGHSYGAHGLGGGA